MPFGKDISLYFNDLHKYKLYVNLEEERHQRHLERIEEGKIKSIEIYVSKLRGNLIKSIFKIKIFWHSWNFR